jgi:hypothetical protein
LSDRIFSYTVILDNCYKDEYALQIQKAIEMIKGVKLVTPLVADASISFALEQVRSDIGSRIMDVIYGPTVK